MIVRPAGDSLLLVTQPDHAVLAREIVESWAALAVAPRRRSILHALEQHDNGWRETDAAPLLDGTTGEIFDFITAPADIRQAIWPRGVARLAADAWAAALVAQHALVIYHRHRLDAAWAPFFAEMTEARDRHLLAAGWSMDDLEHDYFYLRVGDIASLTFCNAWTDEQTHGHMTMRFAGSMLLMDPDPFDGRMLSIAVPARELPNRRYASQGDLRDAFDRAPRMVIRGSVTGRRPHSRIHAP